MHWIYLLIWVFLFENKKKTLLTLNKGAEQIEKNKRQNKLSTIINNKDNMINTDKGTIPDNLVQ